MYESGDLQTVLVFDDDMRFRETLTDRLGRFALKVLTAENTRDALALAPHAQFAFLDLHAPGLTLETYPGFVLDLRRVNPTLVAVLLTGDDSFAARALASRVNVPWYSKATIADDLQGLVREIWALPVDGRVGTPCGGVMDHRKRTFTREGRQVRLSGTQYRIFRCLVENMGWVVTNEDLMVESHLTLDADMTALRNHVSRMRATFKEGGFEVEVEAVPNQGYVLRKIELA